MLGHLAGLLARHNGGSAAFNRVCAERDSGMTNAEAMNSVTESKLFYYCDQDRNGWRPALVQQGLNTKAIAARLGCKSATLKVRCSQAQISLRVPKEVKVVPLVPLALVPAPAAQTARARRCFRLGCADHTATQPSCHGPAAPAGGSNRHDRRRVCHEAA